MVKKEKANKLKRKASVSVDAEEDAEEKDETKGSKKPLSAKKAKRKEITVLYAELTNPGRERKAEEIVKEILELLSSRTASLTEYIASKIGSRVVQACLKWGTRKQ